MLKNLLLFFFTGILLTSCFKEDKTPPVITLYGDSNFTMVIGNKYMEPGFRATDKKDGDITYLVKSTGLPDPNVSGIYYVRYNVTDASGNHAKEMTRICFVSHNNISLSSIYEASETCSETSMNNENYFISIEKEDFNTNSIYLKGYNNLPQEKKIKAIIISNTGQLLTIPQQAIFDTIYSGTGKINISGTLVTLDIIKQYNIFKDSCTTILTRELQ